MPSRKQHLQSQDPNPTEEGCGSLDGKELHEMLGWQNLLEIWLLGALGRPVHRELLYFRTHCKQCQRSFTGRCCTGRNLPEAYGWELLGTEGCCTLLGEVTCTARAGQAEHTGTRREPPLPPVSLQCPVLTKLNSGPAGKGRNLQEPTVL